MFHFPVFTLRKCSILHRYLNDVALHHLIDALCKLSTESMELAFSNRVGNLVHDICFRVVFPCLVAQAIVLWKQGR